MEWIVASYLGGHVRHDHEPYIKGMCANLGAHTNNTERSASIGKELSVVDLTVTPTSEVLKLGVLSTRGC